MAKSRPPLTANELALLKAARAGELQEVESLVAQGVNVNAQSKDFAAPLEALIAAATNTSSMVFYNGKLVPEGQKLWEQKEMLLSVLKALLTAGADPNGASDESLLHRLARRVPDDIRLPIARMLLEHGAHADAIDKGGSSPLVTAVLYKSTDFARLLIDYPVDINRTATRGTIRDIVEDNIVTARRDVASASDDAIRVQCEAELRGLESLLDLLKSRGAKRKSELNIPPERTNPEEVHIASDFLKLVNSGEAEWALLAVKAPFEVVSDAYYRISKSKTRHQNVPLRPAASLEEVPPFAAVVKVKASPWTLILCTIFYVRASHIKHVGAAAKELSDLLKTRALTYAGTEESENGHCELIEGGKSIAKAGDKKSIALLTKENIVLPAFYAARGGDNIWLCVEETSIDMVEQADLIANDA